MGFVKRFGSVALLATCATMVSAQTTKNTDDSAPVNATGPYYGPWQVNATIDPKITPNGPLYTGNYVAPTTAKYDYAEVIHKSYLFYHSQRSGKLPYQRLAWRGDSCFKCTGSYGEDLSGGYYEAANTMKWGLPLGFIITQLAFNLWAFPDAYVAINEWNEGLEAVKWGTDYLINAHPQDYIFVGQLGTSAVGTTDVDFGYFGPPEEYEMWVPLGIMHTALYVTPQEPSSEITGESAAAMAAASVLFKDTNPAYAATLLNHSRVLYNFAKTYPGTYNNNTKFALAKEWYPSSQFQDEIAWAAAWLYIATNEKAYLNDSITYYNNQSTQDSWNEYSWDSKGAGLHVLLYHITKDPVYATNAKTYFTQWLPGIGSNQTIRQTPRGLGYYENWGSLSYAANAVFLMLRHAKDLGYTDSYAKTLVNFAIQQINYILGDCGRSWVVGFGENSPLRPYHKSSYNSYIDYPMRGQNQSLVGDDFLNSFTLNRFILYGALEGGPAMDDSYFDDRTNYVYTEVTQDYNAAFTGALAGLVDYYGSKNFQPFSDCGLDLGWGHKNASKPPTWPDDDCYHTCNKNCSTSKKASSMPTGVEASGPGATSTPTSAATSLTQGLTLLSVSMITIALSLLL
ncbi:Six-hairpin glycosidase-like protein [Jimgerdemannia flammicorona]|uniref:Endoglucanase n=1 Tax=Jimgerdemannia flammicorona TaxID=994334 RepID=A0A433DLE6_9FUNG|nr:Six-hairpin glycosidase-like protein [Jimgerdemannia flammicorona]